MFFHSRDRSLEYPVVVGMVTGVMFVPEACPIFMEKRSPRECFFLGGGFVRGTHHPFVFVACTGWCVQVSLRSSERRGVSLPPYTTPRSVNNTPMDRPL